MTGSVADDRTIVEQCRRGPEGFRHLIEAHQDRVFRFAFTFLRDEEEALDLTQDVFLDVIRNFHAFRGESALSTWLYSIVRNKYHRRLRRESIRRTEPLEEMEAPREKSHGGDDLLAGLPEPFREVVHLFYIDGMSYEEIAAAVGIPVGTVRSRLHLAKDKLRARLARPASVKGDDDDVR